MPYQYNYNKKCNFFKEILEKKKAIKKYCKYNRASRNSLDIKSY